MSERVYLPARNRMREAWDGPEARGRAQLEHALLFQSSAASARAAADPEAALPSATAVFTTLAARRGCRPRGGPPRALPRAAGPPRSRGPDRGGEPGRASGPEPASAVLAQALAAHDGVAVTSVQDALAELRGQVAGRAGA